jgi:tetratricopeptide (TPR) repeat protein
MRPITDRGDSGQTMKARAIIVVALALLVAALVLRTAFVAAYASSNPSVAARAWAGHPAVVFAAGLDEIGRAAAAGKPIEKATLDRLLAASTKAPLAPEPFLVRGVQAQIAGDNKIAEQAFIEARDRDPRMLVARYFLADLYLKRGQTRQGLAEISALIRLFPQSLVGIAPYLAAYARSPGRAPEVKVMIRAHPELEPPLLNALAADPGNLRLILYFWNGQGGESAQGWQQRLLNSLIDGQRYEQARAAWRHFSPTSSQAGELVDPGFTMRAFPPFGWSLASGPSGVAEPQSGGRLHILYYGRDDLVLASQLLLLDPGAHRLSMQISGASPTIKSLAWSVRCLPSSNEIAAIPLAGSDKGGALTAILAVPPIGCTAQRLELNGRSPEFPEETDLTIAGLRLERKVGG